MSSTTSGTETRRHSQEVTTADGRRIGVLIPTPEDDEGTYELTITPAISRSLCTYVASTPGGDASRLWRELGLHPAACSLLRHLASHRDSSPEEELVRLFTIDEAEHGPCDDAIGGIADALTRIEESRRDTGAADSRPR